MKNILKVKYEDLIIKSLNCVQEANDDYFDLDRNFNFFKILLKADNTKNNYSIITYELYIENKKIILTSSKLNIDSDNLKIKLYLKGFVNIRHTNNFSSYCYELDFLN